MNRNSCKFCVLFLISIFILIPAISSAVVRTSLGVVGGIGTPVGWWSERWGPGQSGEVNLRYEFMPGTGLLLLTGLNKVYVSDRSANDIFNDSNLRAMEPEVRQYSSIEGAEQGGAFKQLSIGFGFYTERVVAGMRGYGSLAFVVYNFKFDRSQYLAVNVTPPNLDGASYRRTDIWEDQKEGSEFGGQFAVGLIKQIRQNLLVDVSLAYHYIDVGKTNSALAYWGYPARKTQAKIDQAKSHADYLQLRVGFRYGR
jgi:hypothetical protein